MLTTSRLRRLALTAAGLICGTQAADAQSPPADFKTVASVVSKHLAKQPEYQAGDLITRTQISESLDAVAQRTGWRLSQKQADELIARGVEQRSFLAQQLTTKAGRAFSRQIGKYQLGYDQIDRLSQLPQGRSTIERLVRGPDGYKLLEYMATAKGGHELSRMLSDTPRGGNFEKSTSRIYDEGRLLAELQKLHQAALRAKAATAKARAAR